jgi:thiosulfate/3-mercaptopyruvate sulfurtransferase
MVQFVGTQWLAERLGAPELVIVDPRRPMKYLSGHLPGAINLPVYRAFGADARLLDAAALERWLGGGGIGDGLKPVVYDSPQGQNAAMLAWILEYLGVPEICVLEVFFERWKAEGRAIAYRPVTPPSRRLDAKPNPSVRATLEQVRENTTDRLVDFRSREEFAGERDLDGRPGHIPHAVNVEWLALNGPGDRMLKPRDDLERTFTEAGIGRGQPALAYCRSGPRAALGYLGLIAAGFRARLFDGSFAQWARAGMPVEK